MQSQQGTSTFRERARGLVEGADTVRADRDFSALVFALSMYLACHVALLFARETLGSPWEWLSASLQYGYVWVAYVLIDDRMTQGARRFVLACVATLFSASVLLDGFLMRVTSLPLHEIFPMLLASEHMVEGMREIGLTPARLFALVLALGCSAFAGGLVRLLLAQLLIKARRAPAPARAWSFLFCMLTAFGIEQTWAREQQEDYLFRSLRIPLYAQIYATGARSLELPMPAPASHELRRAWLTQVEKATKPRHVLYVLLESFRADAVDERVSPTLWQLAQQGRWYTKALAEATYTPLSWSVLLFDEAAGDNLFGRHPGRPQPLGGWLFALMERAGLTTHAFVSTNLTYAKTRERLLGRDSHLDFFQAAADVGDDPSDKNHNDRVAIDRAVAFVEQHDWSRKDPQFLLVQLDSTHYTYPFPEAEAVFRPYSESLVLPRPIETQAQAVLLQNRYRNAAHYVDTQLARLVAALEQRGVYDDTLIVVTADHGEGLAPGLQGHAAVADATKHVPLIMRVPGQAPWRSPALVSHRDILPTLARALGVKVPAESLRGRGLDAGDAEGVLTVAPSGRFGQFTTRDLVVDLRLVWKPNALTVTPVHTRWTAASATISGTAPSAAAWLPALRRFISAPQTSRDPSQTVATGP